MSQQSSGVRAMSRLEVNVRRLLGKCELMAKEDVSANWKLEKYVLALDDLVKKLDNLIDKPPKDIMSEYIRRTEFLKGIIETAKLSSPTERIAAAQMLSKTSSTFSSSDINNQAPSIISQIHQKTSAKYNKELRSELFDSKTTGKDGVKQRLLSSAVNNQEDLDSILKYNRTMQEKIAENMILMTSSMKEHALTANAFIAKDMDRLKKSDQLTDKNAVKLKNESLRLEEHTKSHWRCWVWLMVALVLTIFFNMVLFMKVSRKKV